MLWETEATTRRTQHNTKRPRRLKQKPTYWNRKKHKKKIEHGRTTKQHIEEDTDIPKDGRQWKHYNNPNKENRETTCVKKNKPWDRKHKREKKTKHREGLKTRRTSAKPIHYKQGEQDTEGEQMKQQTREHEKTYKTTCKTTKVNKYREIRNTAELTTCAGKRENAKPNNSPEMPAKRWQ